MTNNKNVGESLQIGTFDGIKPIKSHSNFVITFENTTIDYLAERVFKSVLDNNNIIQIRDFAFTNCNDC